MPAELALLLLSEDFEMRRASSWRSLFPSWGFDVLLRRPERLLFLADFSSTAEGASPSEPSLPAFWGNSSEPMRGTRAFGW